MMHRTRTAQSRLETMQEVRQINQRLQKDGTPVQVEVLRKAMMIPDDVEIKPSEREYPDPGLLLMVNPFPKAKKKKKGKKKK